VTPKFRTICLAAVSALAIALPLAGASAALAAPPTAEAFGREAAIRNLSISPDGKYITAITSANGTEAVISVWRTDAMDKPPVNLGCGPRSDCMQVSFVKNDRLSVVVRQTFTSGTDKRHVFRLFITDLEGKKWMNAAGGKDQNSFARARIVDTLGSDPRSVVVSTEDGLAKLDVYTGALSKFYQLSDKFGAEQLDLKGEVRTRKSVDFDNGKVYITQWIRNPATNSWEDHFHTYPGNRESKDIVGFTEDPNIVYLQSNEGQDKAGIFLYDIKARKILEPAFQHKLFEAGGVIQSGAASDYGRLLGFSYGAGDTEDFWIDGKLDSISKGLRKAFGIKMKRVDWTDIATGEKAHFFEPDGADVALSSWSDDLKSFIVVKSGPSQPPEYFLLRDDGKVYPLGKSRPWIDTATLGDTELVQYPARDGLMIPALVTKPKASIWGAGPYPAIVVPHGGPWSRDEMSWDPSGWVQYFAARGYVVIQPQFRGSEGWGQKLWRAGDAEWGQKMQDDMDDGAKWLVAQKIAAPDRMAMHGYSFGGYSAMTSSIRPEGLYQCAVAGAGVAELATFRNRVFDDRILREFQRPTIDGFDPLKNAANAQIPIFLYHGDRDDNVPIEESKRFVAALQKAGKPVKFLELKDMGHSYSTWMPGQATQVLLAVEDYLRKDCGPGGL
jgi:dienelactone hydrolase